MVSDGNTRLQGLKGWLTSAFDWSSGNARKYFQNDTDKVMQILEDEYKPHESEMGLEEFQTLAQEKTRTWQQQIQNGEIELDDIKHEAFALVLETARRLMGMEPRECQITCAFTLNQRSIAEMKTGEGKTLVATMPVYLNALTGDGAHVMTVNDYLADRDANWMGQIYKFLGLSVGVITQGLDDDQRREQYARDITYGTNEQFGFDYLRDNMKLSKQEMVQRGHAFAIIDEADSIMIDEARTPLVISGPTQDKTGLYKVIDEVIPLLGEDDYDIDEEKRTAVFTETGLEMMEEVLQKRGVLNGMALHEAENAAIVHHLNQALKAHKLFTAGRHYIIKDDQAIIVNQSTGRLVPGQRFSDGLHQAIEAKEGVTIQPESQTLASITRQNYLRLYGKLAGMTGTALTEAEEFGEIYGLDVLEVDSHLPLARADESDEVYLTAEEKREAIVKEVKESVSKGQPVLVGTSSVAKSETYAKLFTEQGVAFQMLNARNHAQEAQIIAQAGVPGTVTIATNMAGRGTDIQLGGNVDMRIQQETADIPAGPEREQKIAEIKADVKQKKQQAMDAGGLYVIGTERHESRRIDNQLRGRAGRQGEPGRSKFFLSLEDDLMRIFTGAGMKKTLSRLGIEKGEAIIHPMVNRAVEKAQKRIENNNFEARKNLLKYDDVMNDQRKVVFADRTQIMEMDEVGPIIDNLRYDIIENLVKMYVPENSFPDQWELETLKAAIKETVGLDAPLEEWAQEDGVEEKEILRRLVLASDMAAARRDAAFGPDVMNKVEKMVLLQTFDQMWREHLVNLDYLRSTIHLRSYAQRKPLQEYQAESFSSYNTMLGQISTLVTAQTSNIRLRPQSAVTEQPRQQPVAAPV